MAISNLLQTKPKFPAPSFGMQTTTFNGVSPAPLIATPKPAGTPALVSTPTQGLAQRPSTQSSTFQMPVMQPQSPIASATTAPQPQQGTPGLFNTIATSLAGRATQQSPMTTEAQKAYEKAVEDKLKFERSAIDMKKNIYDAPTSARVMQGRDAAVQQANAETRAALQGAVQQQQAAIGFGQTQQSLEQSALNQAGSLTQPSQNFPFVFDPATGSFTAPGVGGSASGGQLGLSYNPTQDAKTFAQQVMNYQIPYADAVRAMGYAGPTAEALLQQAIAQGGGNLAQLQAQAGVQGSQEQQVQAYRSALQQGKNLQSQLADLIVAFQLNPNDLNAANAALQGIAKQTSGAQYTMLKNYLTDVANTYAQILTPPGGNPTDYTTGLAMSMLNETASGKSIIDVMKSLDHAAEAKIAGVQTIAPTANTGGQIVNTSAGAINTNW